jgi:hypothetical protein
VSLQNAVFAFQMLLHFSLGTIVLVFSRRIQKLSILLTERGPLPYFKWQLKYLKSKLYIWHIRFCGIIFYIFATLFAFMLFHAK